VECERHGGRSPCRLLFLRPVWLVYRAVLICEGEHGAAGRNAASQALVRGRVRRGLFACTVPDIRRIGQLTSGTVVTIMITTVVIDMTQISTRFSVAVHILSLIALRPHECTGDYIAGSVNTNPVIIRRMIGMLKKAGLVDVRPGVGGAFLTKEPDDITLLDVYRAVHAAEQNRLFRIHEDANIDCPVGRNIEAALQSELREAQFAMEERLSKTTLRQLTMKFR